MVGQSAVAFTDGSCIGNPGPGGWAIHVEFPDGRVLELGGGELETTNNRMELRAAIEAIRATASEPEVVVFTDSTYLQAGITRWLADWKRRGWRTRDGSAVQNQDLWKELDSLVDSRVRWEWTPAHVGTPGNERVDRLARTFATGIRRYAPAPSGAEPPRVGRTARPRGAGVAYLSMVNGHVERHETWAECERRVRGVPGARYRKVRGPEEEREVLAQWLGDLVGRS